MADGLGMSEEKRRKAEACARIEAAQGRRYNRTGAIFDYATAGECFSTTRNPSIAATVSLRIF